MKLWFALSANMCFFFSEFVRCSGVCFFVLKAPSMFLCGGQDDATYLHRRFEDLSVGAVPALCSTGLLGEIWQT